VFAVAAADAPLYAYAKYLSAAGKEQSKASKHTRQESSRPAHISAFLQPETPTPTHRLPPSQHNIEPSEAAPIATTHSKMLTVLFLPRW